MQKKLSLLLLQIQNKNVLRSFLKAFFAFSRALFTILPLKLSFFFIVLMRSLNARLASFLICDFRELILKRAKIQPGFRFSSFLTTLFPIPTLTMLIHLKAHQEIEAILAGLADLRHEEAFLWVALAYFDCGEFEQALKLTQLCLIDMPRSAKLQHFKGLMLLLKGNEKQASPYLLAAANHLPAGWCPHQNIAARYPKRYTPLLSDYHAGINGLLYDAYHYLGQQVLALGHGELSAHLYSKAFETQNKLLKSRPLLSSELKKWLKAENLNIEAFHLIPWEWVTQIGHLGMLELLFRMRALGWWAGQAVILAPREKVANQSFLTLFESQTETKIVVPGHQLSESLAAELFSLQRYFGLHFNAWTLSNGKTILWQQAGARLLAEWEAEKRISPLLEVFDRRYQNSAAFKMAEEIKKEWGLKPQDWYVCLHVRDGEFYREFKGFGQTHRNANLKSYQAAIQYIIDHGGWVIKMGGATSSELPTGPRVIHYASSSYKSDFMDLYLLRQAKFFIGTTSGLTNIAVSFDLPCALVNCITTDAQLWNSRVRFAFKPLKVRDKLLGQAQMTSSPWRWRVFNAEALRRYDVIALENSSDEILETVKEVMSLAEGSWHDYLAAYPRSEELYESWQAALSLTEFYGTALPSIYYLTKYEQTYLVKSENPALLGEVAAAEL